MTDNEIIKALECCGRESCNGCPYRNGKCHQGNPMIRDALALINRQKEEIERLEHIRAELSKEADRIAEEHSDLIVEKDELFDIAENALKGMREANALFPKVQAKARAQAVKEFAERLKSKHRRILDYDEAGFSAPTDIVYVETIDNLVKEFTEGDGT